MQRYSQHVPLNTFQRAFLFGASGVAAFINPRRADLVATFGEMTVQPYFAKRLKLQMLGDRIGRQILKEKPRVSSMTLDIQALKKLPPETVGYQYTQWLETENISPDTRRAVRFVDDPEEAYVMQRYRECHDFYHTITGLPVVMEGEVVVKAFEFANLKIPMTGIAALSEPFRLSSAAQKRLKDIYLPWAIVNGLRAKCLLNVYWEHELETNADELRARINIEKPPDLRELRKLAKRKGMKE